MDVNFVYWNSTTNSKTVGWPYSAPYAYQRISQDAAEYMAAGFTAINFPPSCECGGGTLSDGYDKKNDYSLENTAFGNGEMLRQAVASVHAQGMQAYGDLVLHQYGGYPNGNYPTPRFPKVPTCFSKESTEGGVETDPVPNTEGNYAFGDMACYYNSTPAGYMYFGAIAAAQWLTATVNFDGYRIDDVKGTYVGVVKGICDAEGLAQLFMFGEYFDGNPQAIGYWVNYDMDRRASVLDFAFKFNVGNICNNNSNSWMGALANIGWCTADAATAVTFVESADTDTSIGEQIIWNKILGYAIMLTLPGYPRVYYRDWSTDEYCYGLKEPINNLIWIHEHLANGDFVPRYSSFQVFVHERTGYGNLPGCLCGFNNDRWSEHTVTVDTTYPPNTRLHEYTGHYNTDIWTDWAGRVTFTLPPNDNGRGYLVFGTWVEPVGFNRPPIRTKQVFYGAPDLTLPTAAQNGQQQVGRVSVQGGTTVDLVFTPNKEGWQDDTTLTYQILIPGGAYLGQVTSFIAERSGWYTIFLTGSNLPPSGSAFEFTVTYQAPAKAVL